MTNIAGQATCARSRSLAFVTLLLRLRKWTASPITGVTLAGGLLLIGPAGTASAAGRPPLPAPQPVVLEGFDLTVPLRPAACLDDSRDFGARTFQCNRRNYQNWNVHVWGDGTRQLRNIDTGRCLGAENYGSGARHRRTADWP
ncbi:RICIN domain-containing protein [Amycolatopsis sp. lyj-346]|uniref:RICIN domain-containing protein n=1 Tax=Amycolatopsis sp. lyj-346 TaxID=2789289 RepID=UPI00397D5FD5